jgi:hypothetical protein
MNAPEIISTQNSNTSEIQKTIQIWMNKFDDHEVPGVQEKIDQITDQADPKDQPRLSLDLVNQLPWVQAYSELEIELRKIKSGILVSENEIRSTIKHYLKLCGSFDLAQFPAIN